jgi:hypothetical protein
MQSGPTNALESLVSEMEKCLLASREFEIRCAFGVSVGDPRPSQAGPPLLREEEENDACPSWERVCSNFARYPTSKFSSRTWLPQGICINEFDDAEIVKRFRDARARGLPRPSSPARVGSANWLLFATADIPPFILTECESQCEGLEKAARSFLHETGSSLMPSLSGFGGWLAFLCRLAIAMPQAVSYDLLHLIHPFRQTDGWAAQEQIWRGGRIGDARSGTLHWEPFEALLRRRPTLPPGFYALSPSRDVRVISIEAVRLLLKMQAAPAGTQEMSPVKPRDKLAPSARKALQSYDKVMEETGGLETDRQVYNHICDVGSDVYDGKPPQFETWLRYLRTARQLTSTQKNTPRRSKQVGSSVVPLDKLEQKRIKPDS